MSGEPRGRACTECGGAIHLLQRTCEECGTPHRWSCVAACLECGRETDYLDEACACGATHSPWRVVERAARTEGAVTVAKDAVERPSEAGYRRHVGTVRGQLADYRRVLDGGGEFHVRTYLDHYELHIDEVSALDEPAKHTLRYGPRAAAATGAEAAATGAEAAATGAEAAATGAEAAATGAEVARGVAGTARRAGGLVRSALRVPASLVSDAGDQ